MKQEQNDLIRRIAEEAANVVNYPPRFVESMIWRVIGETTQSQDAAEINRRYEERMKERCQWEAVRQAREEDRKKLARKKKRLNRLKAAKSPAAKRHNCRKMSKASRKQNRARK